MPEPLFVIDGLRVDYAETTAVRDVSFEVGAGEVFGLIGPVGAGKSSLLAAAAALVEPTYGDVRVGGFSVFEERERALALLGFMPASPTRIQDLNVREWLDFSASAFGVPRAERATRIAAALDATDLESYAELAAADLDAALRQRLAFARALLHDPSVLLVDVPETGLEPGMLDQLKSTVGDLQAAGKAVVIASHSLAEVEELCTHMGILDEGAMLISGPVADVLQSLKPGRAIRVSLVRPDQRLAEFLSSQPHVRDVEATSDSASFRLEGGLQEAAGLLRRLVESDFPLADFSAREGRLQETLEEVGGGHSG